MGSPAAATSSPARREVRPTLYAAFDFLFAACYAGLLTLAPNRHGLYAAVLWGTVVAIALAGAGMLVRRPLGWRLAVAGCSGLLLLCVTLLVLILLSASYLAGVYGSMGVGAAVIALIGGALVIELCGILPALQLKFLMTRAGRRAYGLEPLWR